MRHSSFCRKRVNLRVYCCQYTYKCWSIHTQGSNPWSYSKPISCDKIPTSPNEFNTQYQNVSHPILSIKQSKSTTVWLCDRMQSILALNCKWKHHKADLHNVFMFHQKTLKGLLLFFVLPYGCTIIRVTNYFHNTSEVT